MNLPVRLREKGRLRQLVSHPYAPIGCSALPLSLPYCPHRRAGQWVATHSSLGVGIPEYHPTGESEYGLPSWHMEFSLYDFRWETNGIVEK